MEPSRLEGVSDREAQQALIALLLIAAHEGASDLHICADSRIFVRHQRAVVYKSENIVSAEVARALDELVTLPPRIEQVLESEAQVEAIARSLVHASDFLFLGRGVHFPVALEGALKLKEVSYIHAEGYPAGEMKHGPNALIDGDLPVVFVATQDRNRESSRQIYEKVLNNIREVRSRDGIIVSVALEGDTDVANESDHCLYVPPADDFLLPVLEIVPLQLLAYHIAVGRGCDVDQPRNLAKSGTVE